MLPIAALAPILIPIVKGIASRIKERIRARRQGRKVRKITVDVEELKQLTKAAVGNAFSRTTGEFSVDRFMDGIKQQAKNQDYSNAVGLVNQPNHQPAQIVQYLGNSQSPKESVDEMKAGLKDLLKTEMQTLFDHMQEKFLAKLKELKK